MTDEANKPQQYWQIQIPIGRLPEPLFHFTQQVAIPYKDEQGDIHNDIGEVVGMRYVVYRSQQVKWYYRVRILKCDYNPRLVGFDDGHYLEESRLVVDNTVIE